ncbi:MAG: acyl-CoA dehydrogenase [Betaproteobacteria bacterium RIFCSPLOWO2_02_FULL_67_26]|nr:MAG: acyl-CoA dehydrogenase [Betaproteobacteria bacterium RIFCSPLOWO2_02_FULL_67_26]
MDVLFTLLAALVVMWILAYHRAPALAWIAVAAVGIGLLFTFSRWPQPLLVAILAVFAVLAALLFPWAVRRAVVSRPLLNLFRRILPAMSQTEQDAIEAGTVWWDGELFSGDPDWSKLLAYPKPTLTAEEQAFLEGPVEELCGMVSDWEITHELNDLPPRVWQFIKDKGFLGMIIPKQYGGLGFSALAHSEVVMKLSTRSGTVAVSVMVPNSLGPAELLLHYGSGQQKSHYLPRLAKGLDIPCFALTSPEAGSDAGAIPDYGIVCRGEWEGRKDVLGIRLTWEKRYITLGPVATLLGLAFRLYDPEHLLGDKDDIGITLGLIPTKTPGVHIGRRHLPLNAAFMNGPNWGKDVFVPMDYVIGGVEYAGEGWKMLMNCLAAGRSISLPALSAATGKLGALATGAYGRVRQQFRLSIGRFEGVEEALARIGGNAYIMEAARVMTAGAIDLGEKPSVVSAIVKYHMTERGRAVINDAMDIHGGKGICMGPNNYLARAYQQTPIAITVEGANILTRSMIIFGQGAIRGHPWVLKEMLATREAEPGKALRDFDEAFFGHLAFTAANKARAFWMGLTGARLVSAPGDRHTKRYYQQLTRLSSAFAWTADVSMFLLGGSLKRRERLSARLGDILSHLYFASCALKRYEDQGRPEEDLPLVHWSIQDALARTEDAFYGLFANLPNRFIAWAMRGVIFPFIYPYGREFEPPRDRLGHEVVGLLLQPGPARERLTAGVYIPRDPQEPVAALEAALRAVIAAEPIGAKIRAARERGMITARFADEIVEEALAKGVITQDDRNAMERAKLLRRQVIMVDDFPRDLGKTEIYQTTQPVTFGELRGRTSWPEMDARGHQPNPGT